MPIEKKGSWTINTTVCFLPDFSLTVCCHLSLFFNLFCVTFIFNFILCMFYLFIFNKTVCFLPGFALTVCCHLSLSFLGVFLVYLLYICIYIHLFFNLFYICFIF